MFTLYKTEFASIFKEFINLIKLPNDQNKEKLMKQFFNRLNNTNKPEYFNWAYEVFEGIHVKENGNRLALHWVNLHTWEEKKYSYHDLANEANQLINYLRGHGLNKGDSVYIILPLLPELWIVNLAIIKAGFIGVPVATTLTLIDLVYRFKTQPPKAIISDEASASLVDDALEKSNITPIIKLIIGNGKKSWESYDVIKRESTQAEPTTTKSDDPIYVFFTSGTTGMPKRVVHTATSYPVGHLTTAMIINVQPGEVHNNLSAPGWAKYAWSSFFAPFIVGATTTGFYYSGRLEPDKYLHAIEELKVSTFCAPPTAWRAFLKGNIKKFNFENIHDAVSAGEPLGAGVYVKVLDEIKLEVRDFYGQTETTAMIGNPPWFKGHILPGSVGIPTFMYNMVLLDDEGNEITNPGEIGHIAVKLTPWRPIGLLKGYMEEQRNKEAFKGEYYLTGDKAYFDEKGYWWFVGRADDVIKTSDYRVGPSEVESVLIQHPAIAEIAVVGSPHPEKYQVVKAFIVLKPGYNPSKELALDIFKYAKHQLAYYKIPRILEFVDDFPKTISGKILRRELRKLEEDKKSKGIKEKYEYFYDEFPELKK